MGVVVLVVHRVEVLVTVLVDDLLSQKELGWAAATPKFRLVLPIFIRAFCRLS